MILSAKTLRALKPVAPFRERTIFNGMSYGLSLAGYDIRLRERVKLTPRRFALGSSIEEFDMPLDVLARVHDKSSWVRQGLTVANTVIEPGWKGFLTLELFNQSDNVTVIPAGSPIAQIVFEYLDFPSDTGYQGKYQNQPAQPVPSLKERLDDRQLDMFKMESKA